MIQYDPDTAWRADEVWIDVASGSTGGGARDRKMHKDFLASPRFPDAVFTPTTIEGSFSPKQPSDLTVHGIFRIVAALNVKTEH